MAKLLWGPGNRASGAVAISAWRRFCVWGGGLAIIIALVVSFPAGLKAAEGDTGSYVKTLDVIDAVFLPKLGKIAYITQKGAVGTIDVNGSVATAREIARLPDENFTCVLNVGGDQLLIGTSGGKLFRFDGENITEVAALSEYKDPILSLSVVDSTFWVTGGRGLLAKSTDAKEWEIVEVGRVKQPPMPFTAGETGTLYFGVANILTDTVVVSGTVEGKPAVADQDYAFHSDEGMIDILNPFDEVSAPSIAFDFQSGPPFQAGDVTWNVVLQKDGRLTIAGEFGLIFQSDDGGQSWVRRNGRITKTEAAQYYWISGQSVGDKIVLGGAAGLVGASDDRGETWVQLPRPGREGVFGVRLQNGERIFISGAVGLAGSFDEGEWNLVDRSATNLYSWLKTFVELADGSLILLGGNSTVLAYQNGEWERIQLTIE